MTTLLRPAGTAQLPTPWTHLPFFPQPPTDSIQHFPIPTSMRKVYHEPARRLKRAASSDMRGLTQEYAAYNAPERYTLTSGASMPLSRATPVLSVKRDDSFDINDGIGLNGLRSASEPRDQDSHRYEQRSASGSKLQALSPSIDSARKSVTLSSISHPTIPSPFSDVDDRPLSDFKKRSDLYETSSTDGSTQLTGASITPEEMDQPPSYEASVVLSIYPPSRTSNSAETTYSSESSAMNTPAHSVVDFKQFRVEENTDGSLVDGEILPSPSWDEQDPSQDQDELLPYLQGDMDEGASVENEVPITLRPREGRPIPSESQAPSRGLQVSRQNVPFPPNTTRTFSEPLSTTSLTRPYIPRRGNTASPRVAAVNDLDRIDELDETTLNGIPMHHRGPYETAMLASTPPVRMLPIEREQPPNGRQVIVAGTSYAHPPPPMPFQLGLKPGEVLSRLPPQSYGSYVSNGPRHPLAPVSSFPSAGAQPPYGNAPPIQRDVPQDRRPYDPRFVQRDQYREPREYENRSADSRAMTPGGSFQQHPIYREMRNYSPSQSASSSLSDVRTQSSTSSQADCLPPGERLPGLYPASRQFVYSDDRSFQEVYQPSHLASSLESLNISSSIHSRAPTIRSQRDGPPPPVELHRPRQLVMPTPLQQQQQQRQHPSQPSTTSLSRTYGTISIQPSAAVIPIHDPRKSLLKKRATTGSSLHHGRQQQPSASPLPMPDSTNDPIASAATDFGKGLYAEPERKVRHSRKLSKRKTAF